MKYWTEDMIDSLSKLYPDNRNVDIAKKLGVTKSAIENKANRLKLRKSDEFKPKLMIKRNKLMGRDLTYNLLKEIASKFKTRSDFQYVDPSAYTTARRAKILNDICNHMAVIKFSIPQLMLRDILDSLLNSKSVYNDRKMIKPYEIDIYYPEFNIGFEYQGRIWHINNKKDKIKAEILKNKNIPVIYINEYNRKYEDNIKQHLIDNLLFINKICKKNINKNEILNYKFTNNVYDSIYNKNDLINIAKKYNSYSIFYKNEKSVYRKLKLLNIIDDATSHMKDKKRKHSLESVKIELKKYKSLLDLIKGDTGIYLYIKRNNLNYLLKDLKTVYKKNYL